MRAPRHAAARHTKRVKAACHYGFIVLALLTLLAVAPRAHAASGEDDEWDVYKVRADGFWFYSHPAGHFTSAGNTGFFDLQQDIGFQTYSTFAGKVDWKFTHKNHLYLSATEFDQNKTVVLDRNIVFQGASFNAGATATGNLHSLILAPGYQYDFTRRKRGSLGVQVQVNIIDITGSLNAAAQVNGGIPQSAAVGSGTLRVPLPVAGPTMRYYIFSNSDRLFVDANVLGMYFFGYGNYVSSIGTLGLTITRNLSIRGGYQLASRFDISTKQQRLGVTLSQKGALAGLEISF